MNRQKHALFLRVGAVALWLIVWQAAAMLVNKRFLLAAPSDVLLRLATIWQEPNFFATLGTSLANIALGFFLGLLFGVLLAVLAGKLAWLEILLRPLMLTVKSVPVASFIVIALIWLSPRDLSVFISFLMVLPIIYNNVLGGLHAIDPQMTQMSAVYGLSFGKKLRYLWLPSIEPHLLSACKTALGLSWKAGIAAEVIGLPSGSIGEMLYDAKAYLDTVDLFAWTLLVVAISVGLEKLIMLALKKFFTEVENV